MAGRTLSSKWVWHEDILTSWPGEYLPTRVIHHSAFPKILDTSWVVGTVRVFSHYVCTLLSWPSTAYTLTSRELSWAPAEYLLGHPEPQFSYSPCSLFELWSATQQSWDCTLASERPSSTERVYRKHWIFFPLCQGYLLSPISTSFPSLFSQAEQFQIIHVYFVNLITLLLTYNLIYSVLGWNMDSFSRRM